MSGAFVDYVRPDKQSGNLIYRRRFPDELVLFIPRADGRGMGRKELRVSLFAKNMDDPGAADRWAQRLRKLHPRFALPCPRQADHHLPGADHLPRPGRRLLPV